MKNPNTVAWHVREYIGHEVKSSTGDIITGDIYPGDVVLLWNTIQGIVVEFDKKFYADSGTTLWILEYKKDDRQCWVSTGAINKKILERGGLLTFI